MNRYFIEVCYKGKGYAGFQVQDNAVTIQSELESAMKILFQEKIGLTGSSRTDSGVHSRQNYFHFDSALEIPMAKLYNLNAILPPSIAVKHLRKMHEGAHCRFDAVSRKYLYTVYSEKDPFMEEDGYYFPYRLNLENMQAAAGVLLGRNDYSSFSKRNTQVNNFFCNILESHWHDEKGVYKYNVKANRFLRGMVRGLVGTMLQVGRGKISVDEFRQVILMKDSSRANFAVPGKGLCLMEVGFPEGYFENNLKEN